MKIMALTKEQKQEKELIDKIKIEIGSVWSDKALVFCQKHTQNHQQTYNITNELIIFVLDELLSNKKMDSINFVWFENIIRSTGNDLGYYGAVDAVNKFVNDFIAALIRKFEGLELYLVCYNLSKGLEVIKTHFAR